MDVTPDTVTSAKLLANETATGADGVKLTGSIATKTSSDMTASGATVTAPAGYYASSASKSVSSGSAKTPATTVTANPTISVNSSTGLITATTSATKSVTPTVTAGYVSSGTAGTITVSGSKTSQLSTQAATTITPTTSSQTAVAAGKYTTGAVTVGAIPSQYIVPSGTKSITENGTGIDVTSYANVDVSVSSSSTLLPLTVTPTTSQQSFTAGAESDLIAKRYINDEGSTSQGLTFSIDLSGFAVGDTCRITGSLNVLKGGANYDVTDISGSFVWASSNTYTKGVWTLTITASSVSITYAGSNSGSICANTNAEDGSRYIGFRKDVVYDGYNPVTVNAIPSQYIIPSGTISISSNGTVDVTNYASANVEVSGGGGGGDSSEKNVYFIDYDGTILHSYTDSEFAQLSNLPSNPSHTGLTAQGWNWTKAQITSQLSAIGAGDIVVGQMYTTNDGKTRIYVDLVDGCTSPYLSYNVEANQSITVTIDWGDGTSPQVLTHTTSSSGMRPFTQHNYSSSGNYTISISVTGGNISIYGVTIGSTLFGPINGSSSDNARLPYQSCIKRIEIGSGVIGLSDYALYKLYALSSITIPNTVTSMGTYSLGHCRSLVSVVIPNSITSIGTYAFASDYSLSLCSIPGTATSIGTYAFNSCSALQRITIPSGVTTIEASTFSTAGSLYSVAIPGTITTINSSAFLGCQALSVIKLPNSITTLSTSVFSGCHSLASMDLPTNITTIPGGLFNGCYALKSVTIPNTVTSIGDNAFNSCESLRSIDIPSGVTSIGTNAFQKCKALESITLPSNIGTTFPGYSFESCYSLKAINIPSGITTISGAAFTNCYALQSVTLPNSVTTFSGSSTFSNCYALSSISLPSGITSLGTYTFVNCVGLSSIAIPEGVTAIPMYAFDACASLRVITIPSTVTSIGNYAFRDCKGISEYHMLPETPPTLGTNDPFKNIDSRCIIYVPYSSDHSILEAYQTAWSAQSSIIQEEPQ